jgi:putative membrane protein insertion efficiency factor
MSRLRAATWAVGAPLRWLLLGLIRAYQLTLSGWLGGQCRFYPTCSHYAADAIKIHGALKGSSMAVWRIARCGPFTDGGVDHVPPRKHRHGEYDSVTHAAGAAS